MARENGPEWGGAGTGDAGSGPPMTAGYIGAPGGTAGTPLAAEAAGFPLPADLPSAEPSPRRRRIIPLAAAALTLMAAVAVTAIVLGKTSARNPTATQAPTPAAARTFAPERALQIGQLRAGDCLQGPPDINTARSWPDIAIAVPCHDKHLAEVYFFSANYWPTAMAFPGNAKIAHQAKTECRKEFQAYDGAPLPASEFSFRWIHPVGRPDWDSGDRLLLCTAYVWDSQYPHGVPLYTSIKGSYT